MSETTASANNNNESITSTVAKHYDDKKSVDVKEREFSRIYYMRNFNNWIKSCLINEFINKIYEANGGRSSGYKLTVHDLGCGKGGDILKWSKNNVKRIIFSDLAAQSLEECKQRAQYKFELNEFVHLDATRESIVEKMDEKVLSHLGGKQQCCDLVSSQFVIHYSFESFEQANMFMRNVSDTLKVGGYFVGTTTNCYEIVKRLRNSPTNSFGNRVYKITFDENVDKNNIKLFGARFDFELDNVVGCPEFLLNFDALIKLADRYGMQLVYKKRFDEMFEEKSQQHEDRRLISVIKAFEPYYPSRFRKQQDQLSTEDMTGEYEAIESRLRGSSDEDETFRSDLRYNEYYATLSNSEWEAITLYLAFAFKKIK